MNNNKSLPQFIWGIALTFVGISMFIAIPQKVAQISNTEQYSSAIMFSIKLCFYLISILLTGGGIRKIISFLNYKVDEQ